MVKGSTLIAVLLSAAAGLGFSPGASAGNTAAASGPTTGPGINAMSKSSLRHHYRIHLRRRNIIAAHLNRLWSEERELVAERDRLGRAGDMVSVTQLERELYGVRMQIDRLRAELTKENQIMALIDQRMNAMQ
ncbi:MAG TPA: hypothetical protein V6D08_04315 [Candidatus Obscuribacterales bacterium]